MFSNDNKLTEQLTVVRRLGNMICWKLGVICPVPVEGRWLQWGQNKRFLQAGKVSDDESNIDYG